MLRVYRRQVWLTLFKQTLFSELPSHLSQLLSHEDLLVISTGHLHSMHLQPLALFSYSYYCGFLGSVSMP